MKSLAFALTLCAAALAQPALSPVPVKATKLASPEKALKFEVTVPAELADVWNALTTTDGLNTWLWRDCAVDLRPGGGWVARFPGGSTAGGTIESLQTRRQLVIHAMAPEQFPEVRRLGTTAAFDLQPEGARTRVTLTQTGWRQGREWDDAYEYLARGNAQLLGQLYLRFARGPLKWE